MVDKTIYSLGLHETFMDNSLLVSRVPGGWIYTLHRLDCGQMNSVFVPFDNEFGPKPDIGCL